MDSALVGDNPDQRKEREPASDLKHELPAPFHERCGCCIVFSALTLASISVFGVRSVSISENAKRGAALNLGCAPMPKDREVRLIQRKGDLSQVEFCTSDGCLRRWLLTSVLGPEGL